MKALVIDPKAKEIREAESLPGESDYECLKRLLNRKMLSAATKLPNGDVR